MKRLPSASAYHARDATRRDETQDRMSRGNLDAIKADYLKKKGDADTRKENYGDAIKHYTEALQVSPTLTHTHQILLLLSSLSLFRD